MDAPSDTSPEAARVQRDLFRQATTAQRAALALSLSDTAIGLSRRALRAARPELTDQELGIEFVRVHYGDELAEKVRASLRSRS